MAAGNRLTKEQIAALAPGDTVTIETGSGFGRFRHTSGTVVRTGPSHVVVSVEGPRGGTFIERYSLRDGVRVGGVGRAELVCRLLRVGILGGPPTYPAHRQTVP